MGRETGEGGVRVGERERLVREGLVWGERERDSGKGGVSVGRERLW